MATDNPGQEFTADDGTVWINVFPGPEDGWTGWEPGVAGVWLKTPAEMAETYPEVLAEQWTAEEYNT